MKTPREIILERHRAAEKKLNVPRKEELAALARTSAVEPPANLGTLPPSAALPNAPQNFGRISIIQRVSRLPILLRAAASKFWLDAIWPWRKVWAGFAAVWLGILALHFNTGESSASAGGNEMARSNPQVMTALREQKQMFAQLLEGAPYSIARPKLPGPRSEQRHELFIA
jgi:hypothetical protein